MKSESSANFIATSGTGGCLTTSGAAIDDTVFNFAYAPYDMHALPRHCILRVDTTLVNMQTKVFSRKEGWYPGVSFEWNYLVCITAIQTPDYVQCVTVFTSDTSKPTSLRHYTGCWHHGAKPSAHRRLICDYRVTWIDNLFVSVLLRVCLLATIPFYESTMFTEWGSKRLMTYIVSQVSCGSLCMMLPGCWALEIQFAGAFGRVCIMPNFAV